MDERLSLGIPDRSAIDAPARRFALVGERSRVRSIAPAILAAAWGLLLKQVLGGSEEAKPHRPQAADSDPRTTPTEPEAVPAAPGAERSSGSSDLVRAFGLASVSMNEEFERAVDLDRLAFAKTDGPRLSLVPANQNSPAPPHSQLPAGETKPRGG